MSILQDIGATISSFAVKAHLEWIDIRQPVVQCAATEASIGGCRVMSRVTGSTWCPSLWISVTTFAAAPIVAHSAYDVDPGGRAGKSTGAADLAVRERVTDSGAR